MQFAAVLEEAGFPVFRSCTSGSEVKRSMHQYSASIVLCASRLPDCTAEELAWDLSEKALMLVTGRPQQREMCEHPDVFRLTVPCSKGELTSAVNMLVQLHQMRLPRSSENDVLVGEQAKENGYTQEGLSEPQ